MNNAHQQMSLPIPVEIPTTAPARRDRGERQAEHCANSTEPVDMDESSTSPEPPQPYE